MKKWQIKKIRDLILCLMVVVFGIVTFILGFTQTAPGFGNKLETAITLFIAYGFFGGIFLTIIGTWLFFKVRNKDYTKKAVSQKRRV